MTVTCENCGRPFDDHELSEDEYGREIYLCPSDEEEDEE